MSSPSLLLEWANIPKEYDYLLNSLYLSSPFIAKYLNIIRSSNNCLGLISECYTTNLSNYKECNISIDISSICKQILIALEYLNSKGVLCTFLTLDSILIDTSNSIKLSRYAIPIWLQEKNALLNNILYLSPETLIDLPLKEGSGLLNDVWSLGIILLQLLDRPFNQILNSLSQINLTHAANVCLIIIYHSLLTISTTNRISFSLIGLDNEIIMKYMPNIEETLSKRLADWYSEAEISEIKKLPILDKVLEFITGSRLIDKYYEDLTKEDIELLGICYKCLMITPEHRPTATRLLDEYYAILRTEERQYVDKLLYSDVVELFLYSDLSKYITAAPSKYHCSHPIMIKIPKGVESLRKLRRECTFTSIAGIYALTIRPTCGYSRRVDLLYNWLRMCRFDHILKYYDEYQKIVLAEARIDFPVSHRLIVYFIALEIRFNDMKHKNIEGGYENNYQFNHAVVNKFNKDKIKNALDYLLTDKSVVYYPGLEDICAVITSITDNQQVINELFRSIVNKFVKQFYSNSGDIFNSLMEKFDNLLRFFDPEIYYYLVSMDFNCNSFLMEWLATLFTHVLSPDNLLICWDSIIVQGVKYEDYILYIAIAIIYGCKSYILSSGDANELLKSIKRGTLFINVPMVTAMATRLASIYNYVTLKDVKNVTVIDESSTSTNSLKMFEANPLEVLSLAEICGIDLHRLFFIRVIGSFEFYESFLMKYKYSLVQQKNE